MAAIEDEFDREIAELVARNKKNLEEMQYDLKKVSRIAGEPVVKVRKGRALKGSQVMADSEEF